MKMKDKKNIVHRHKINRKTGICEYCGLSRKQLDENYKLEFMEYILNCNAKPEDKKIILKKLDKK